jgi:LuxR family transcriptional regulator, maltose regulon positive regulatory protein
VAGPLLESKLHVPSRRRALVARQRLIERLSRGAESALTLVSAPAGFGKTTLLTEWLAADPVGGRSVAWLSLDQRDNDPAVFWTYLVAALQRTVPGAGPGALALLQAPRPPIDEGLAVLLNDLRALSDEVVLVLDDYHVIVSREVQEGMAFLLEHLPPQIHVVIAGRTDPAVAMARWRARGELVEIRAADLRFTPVETQAYLNAVMGLTLSAQEVATLEGRTEGWIAALQLAALSMQGRDDVAGFIAGFAGDDRYIVDYLVEEVLQRQPGHVRNFLLQTSVLSRLSGSLCDAVSGQDGGQAMLEALERNNLFLVPLDDRRRWYRYHHLFADVLGVRLRDEQPGSVHGLHLRASEWYEQNGEPSEAIRHAMAAGDVERAADLVELSIPAIRQGRQEATLRRWLAALPDKLIKVRPVLSVGYAGALLAGAELEGVEVRLRDAERWLDAPTVRQGPRATSDMVVVDEEGFRHLPETIEVYRAAQALGSGDLLTTVRRARRALDLSAEDDHVTRAAAAGFLGLASWTAGDLEVAHQAYAECMAGLHRAGYLPDVLGCVIALADIRISQGRLGEAMRAYERALQLAPEQGQQVLRGTADMHVGMSEVHLERGDLEAATEHLLRSQELGEHAGLAQHRYRRRVALARLREAEGDFDGALELLGQAERFYTSDFFPDVRPVPALRARMLVAQGAWREALGWAHEHGLSVEDDLSYVREFEHITLARLLLARYMAERREGSLSEARALLARLLRAAEEGARTGVMIEILVLQSLAHQAGRNLPAALTSLRSAVTLSEREGYVRVFVHEGPLMAALLRALAKQSPAQSHVRRLLAAAASTTDSTTGGQALIAPLSERELQVLRLLGTDLDGPDIARRLTVSLSTVRTHTRNVYAKLGVNNRRAAVRRGQELDLLSRDRHRQGPHLIVHDKWQPPPRRA